MADDSDSTLNEEQTEQYENDPEFDYNVVKQKYFEQIEKIKSAGEIRALYSKKRIECIVNILKDSQIRCNNRWPRMSTHYRVVKRYYYDEHDGKTLLFLKKTDLTTDSAIQVIAIEDSFDILMEVHLNTGHGGRDKMSKMIKNRYYIYKPCLQIMINACNVCCDRRMKYEKDLFEKFREQENEPQFNSTVYIDILDMKTSPDGKFNHILVYQDKQTNFVLLRPLMRKEATEIAFELFKIFVDYGEPQVILTNNVPFLDCVIGEVKQFDFLQANSGNIDIKEEFRRHFWLLAKINLWIEKTGSNNWPIGCFEIQFEINATERNKKVPYRAVFNRTPNVLESIFAKTSDEMIVNANPVPSNSLSKSDLSNKTITAERKVIDTQKIAQTIPEKIIEFSKKMPCVLFKRKFKKNSKVNQCKTSLRERLSKQFDLPKSVSARPKIPLLKKKDNVTAVNTVDTVDTKQNIDKSIGDMIDATIESSFGNEIKIEEASDINLPTEHTKEIQVKNEPQCSTVQCTRCKICNRKLIPPQVKLCCDRCQQYIHETCGDWCIGLPGSKSVVVYLCMICKQKESKIRKLKKKAESIENMLQNPNDT